jgi:hypothetical protein
MPHIKHSVPTLIKQGTEPTPCILSDGLLGEAGGRMQGVSLRNLSKKTGMTALHVAAYYGEEGDQIFLTSYFDDMSTFQYSLVDNLQRSQVKWQWFTVV